MIHNAVLHLLNDQPVLVDLYELPTAGDPVLVCTNLRAMNGSRPVFADNMKSMFFFPFAAVRFLEVPPSALGVPEIEASTAEPEDGEAELEIDEDFLRRIKEV